MARIVVDDPDPARRSAAKLDFRMKKDSKAFTEIAGFQPIPSEKIGLYTDPWRTSLPKDAGAGE